MEQLLEWVRRRDRVLVMGALNVTLDSFYDGGKHASAASAVERALEMVEEGADVIDVGGESSRPGATPVSLEEELERVVPVIEGIRKRSEIPLSVDTTKAAVAREAIARGASIVNDISALRFDPALAQVVAASGSFVILMHMQGEPRTMQLSPSYTDPVGEIRDFLAERIEFAVRSGIARERIFVDPGIGFGKRLEHNLEILRNLSRFTTLGAPLLVGVSRKRFLGEILDLAPEERLEGTIAANAVAVAYGADAIRVHDVKEGRRAADVARRLRRDAA
jgi:dihydropteroate synthase